MHLLDTIENIIDKYQPIRSVGQVKKIAEEIDNITNPGCVVKIVQDNSYHHCYLTYEKIENNSWIRTYVCDSNVVWEPHTVTTYELADNLTNEDNVMSRVTVSERNITTVSELNSILESLLENTTNLTNFNNYTCSILEGDVISFTDFKRQKEAEKNLNEAIHVDIKKIKIRWCESAFGNVFFKDGEEMSYEDFQKRVYVADYFLQPYEGYCKCAYTAIIEMQEGPHGEPEETTYDGRVYLGNGQQYVNLMVNMEQFINKSTGKAVFFDNVPVTMTNAHIQALAKLYKTPYKEPEKNIGDSSQNSLVKDYSNNETKTGEDVEVGDILYVSWGYDMTIVDFYRVIQRKKASINLEKLESKEVSSNKVMPIDKVVPDSVVDGKTFRISRYGVCKIDGHTARYWKGNPMYSSDMD